MAGHIKGWVGRGACGLGSRCSPPGDSRRLLHWMPVRGGGPAGCGGGELFPAFRRDEGVRRGKDRCLRARCSSCNDPPWRRSRGVLSREDSENGPRLPCVRNHRGTALSHRSEKSACRCAGKIHSRERGVLARDPGITVSIGKIRNGIPVDRREVVAVEERHR